MNKLGGREEKLKDIDMARQRLADAEFISREKYDRYIRKRLGKK